MEGAALYNRRYSFGWSLARAAVKESVDLGRKGSCTILASHDHFGLTRTGGRHSVRICKKRRPAPNATELGAASCDAEAEILKQDFRDPTRLEVYFVYFATAGSTLLPC